MRRALGRFPAKVTSEQGVNDEPCPKRVSGREGFQVGELSERSLEAGAPRPGFGSQRQSRGPGGGWQGQLLARCGYLKFSA